MVNEYDPNFVEEKVFAIVGSKAVVQHDDGEILFMRRSEKCVNPRKWDYPGGGIDKGEDPIEGVRREALEEAGVVLTKVIPVQVFSEFNGDDFVVMIGYSALTKQKKITLSWEHDKYMWLPKKEALEVELVDVKKDLLKKHFEFGFGSGKFN